MVEIFTIQAGGIEKRRCGFFEGDPVLEFVAFRLAGVPVEYLLCIYNIPGRLKDTVIAVNLILKE